MMLRRRVMGKELVNPYEGFIHLITKNNGTNRNIFSNNIDLDKVDKLIIEGEEISPAVYYYDFGDTELHDVYVSFKDNTTIPSGGFYTSTGTRQSLDIPESYVVFGSNALRATTGTVIIRSTIMPTFGSNNNMSWGNSAKLYIPDSLYDDYIAEGAFGALIGVSKVHKISEL